MGLILPGGPSWAYTSHSMPSTLFTNTATFGVQVASGTGSADGSAVTLISALSHDAEYLRLALCTTKTSDIDNNCLMDILIDPAGGTSWSVLIPSLACTPLTNIQCASNSPIGPSGFYDFPIWIPAGASIGARARNAGGTLQTLGVYAMAMGGNANPASWWCGQRVTAIGVDAANSRGSTHTPGASGAFSSWANFGSTLGEACGALQFAAMGEHTFGSTWGSGTQEEWQFGVGSVQIGPSIWRAVTSTENGWWVPTGPIFKRLAAGTQLMTRGKNSASSPPAKSICAYAVH